MPKFPGTKRKACIVVVLAAFLVVYLFVLRRTDSGKDTSEITSISFGPQPSSGSIAAQNKWTTASFFSEPKAVAFGNLIMDNDAERIDELIRSENVDLNCMGNSGMNALHWAFVCGRKEVVLKLLQAGANPDIKLLQSIPVKNGTPLLEGDTFAFTTLRQMDIDMFDECLNYVQDPNQRDRYGDTLLHKLIGQIAFNSGPGERYFKLTERLIDTGVDVNAKNSHGSTPLHIVFMHLPEFGPLLLERNANPQRSLRMMESQC